MGFVYSMLLGLVVGDYQAFLAEHRFAENAQAECAVVLHPRCRHQLVAHLAAAVGLATVGNIRRRLLLDTNLVDHLGAFKQVDAALARVQTEVGVHAVAHLVAVHHHVALALHRLEGQFPRFVRPITQPNPVFAQIHACRCRIIQFHPRVGEIVQIVHRAVNVRLHQLVNHKRRLFVGSMRRSCCAQHSGEE